MLFKDSILPYGRQRITESDIEAVVDVLKSPFLTQGPVVERFEQAITEKIDAKYAVAVNSATSALHVACHAMDLKKGDWLWTTPNTFVASANCAIYCSAKVDFVDIEPDTGLMCPISLEKKLKKAKKELKLPKIVVPVHLSGTSCDMKAIKELSELYKFEIIEDASHAIGGKYENSSVGSCKYSTITVFSLHPVKIITSGEGGIATTNSEELATKMRDLRSHGITKDRGRFEIEESGPWHYEQQDLGFNYRLSDIHAALGLSQLKRLEEIVKIRQNLLDRYNELLNGVAVKLLRIPSGIESAVHLAIVRLEKKDAVTHRQVFEALRQNKIGVQVHYTPVHLQPFYRRMGYKEGDFPKAEAYAKNAISLPLYEGLTEEDQKRVVNTLKVILEKK